MKDAGPVRKCASRADARFSALIGRNRTGTRRLRQSSPSGAPVRFSDREEVEKILGAAKASQYGVRGLVHALVQSELFRNK